MVVVMHSGGAGSWAAGMRAAQRYGTERLVLLFADVGGDSLHPHTGEDEDVYRFVVEGAARIGGELVRVADGRTVWEVFRDERMIGNTRLSVCSRALKQRPVHAWLEANAPDDALVVVGIDWSEAHRLPAMERAYAPRQVWAPLTEPPLLDREQVLQQVREAGLEPPAMYAAGFPHANCGGFCVRAGQGQFLQLLEQNPDRYAWHEQQEQDLRDRLGKDVAILRDRRGGTTRPLTLRTLRERAEGAGQVDHDDIGGCGCFVDEGTT